MRTQFDSDQLTNPFLLEAEKALRSCVHCGFCLPACPTYTLLGDERDSPRGRIYLMRDMLEQDAVPDAETVKHIDRCLSCLSCAHACPSGVNYAHLVDQARAHIEQRYRRSLFDHLMRSVFGWLMPRPGIMREAMTLGHLAKPFRFLMSRRVRAMLQLLPPAEDSEMLLGDHYFPAQGSRKLSVVLSLGCVQQITDQHIHESTVRLLRRLGADVHVLGDMGCCGSLNHHLGQSGRAQKLARKNVDALWGHREKHGLDAIISNASGCGSTWKDYGSLLADDPDYANKAKTLADVARDITEVLQQLGYGDAATTQKNLKIAWQAPCSLQHGQQCDDIGADLLRRAGYDVVEPAESWMCCGSAGSYSFLEPDISATLRERKAEALSATSPHLVATANVGCQLHLAGALDQPIVHVVELLDWAAGGPKPKVFGEET